MLNILDIKEKLISNYLSAEFPSSKIIYVGVDNDILTVEHQDFSKSTMPEREKTQVQMPEDLSLYEEYICTRQAFSELEYERISEKRFERIKENLTHNLIADFIKNNKIDDVHKSRIVISDIFYEWWGEGNFICEGRMFYKWEGEK